MKEQLETYCLELVRSKETWGLQLARLWGTYKWRKAMRRNNSGQKRWYGMLRVVRSMGGEQ